MAKVRDSIPLALIHSIDRGEPLLPLFMANLEAAIALHFAFYNFCRIHQTLRVTPAMAAGVTDRVWEIADLVAMLD